MFITIVSSLCLLALISSTPIDKRSENYQPCTDFPTGTLVSNPTDCSKYYTCVHGATVSSNCAPGTWFDEKLKICNSIGSFSEEEMEKCYGNNSENRVKRRVKRSYMKKEEANVKWIQNKTKTSNDSLPDKIIMELPLGSNDIAKLEFVKRANYTKNIKVFTIYRGRPEQWDPENSEEWCVYSDRKSNASMSVVTRIVNGIKTVHYDGMFTANDTKYQIREDTGFRSYPINKRSARLVVMNDTEYIVCEDRNETNLIDNEGRESTSATSVMSQLESLVAKKEAQQHSSKKRYGIELLIVLDYSIYYKWFTQSSATDARSKSSDAISSIRYFYTHIINGINDRYMGIEDSDMSFYVKIMGYTIAQTPEDSPFTEQNGIKYGDYAIEPYAALTGFEKWIAAEAAKPERTLPNFDSAALFTDYEMRAVNFEGKQYTITGLANIGATCTMTGASINKDQGQYATIETAAHEIGHNLGALHDGDNNECKGVDQYIMANTPGPLTDATFYNPYKFSPCSIRYFKDYIRKLDSENKNCLPNEAVNKDDAFDENLKTLPGQKYDANLQCRLLYGDSSFYCAGGGERDKLICKSMSCFNPKSNQCISKVEQRALDGTLCGNGAWCLMSTCTTDARAKNGPDACMYGDFKGEFQLENINVNCEWMVKNRPYRCYEDYFNNLCCASCAANTNKNFPTCEWGNKLEMCSTINKDMCYEDYYKEKCCSKCKEYEMHIPNMANCRYGNKANWCETIDKYSCSNSEEVCCETCSKFKTNVIGCEYGDSNPGCTVEHCQHETYLKSCCDTCQNFIKGTQISNTTTTLSSNSPACPRGDQASWCSTVSGADCYGASSTCCTSCKKFYNQENVGCEYGDKASWCSLYVHSAFECQNEEVAKQCCNSCAIYQTDMSVIPSCPMGDQSDYCNLLKSFECYTFKSTCCDTCYKHYDSKLMNCEYGDKVDWCKTYVQGPDECKRPDIARYCCKTCNKMKFRKFRNKVEATCKDNADWCSSMFLGFCYDPKVESTCCSTCSNGRKASESCKYGDLYNWCEKQYCSMNARECCETCN